jgi:hypothetical protein
VNQWGPQGAGAGQAQWYHQPQGNKQVQGYGPQGQGQGGQRNGAQRRRDGQGGGQGQGGNKQNNRRQQQVAQRPQPVSADYYDDYDTAEGSSGFSLMEYVPQSLRRVCEYSDQNSICIDFVFTVQHASSADFPKYNLEHF